MKRAANQLEELIAGTALVIVVLSVVWGVITRYLTSQPAPWTSEVAGIAFAWCIFVGAAAGLKRGQHVSIDMLVGFLPPGARLLADQLAAGTALLFCAVATWLAANFTAEVWDNPTAVLRLPSSILYGAVAAGFLLMTLRSLQRMLGRPWTG